MACLAVPRAVCSIEMVKYSDVSIEDAIPLIRAMA